MKINVGTNCGNLQRVDTKGIKRDDLTMKLVRALCEDEIADNKHPNHQHKDILIIHGWCQSRRSKW